MSSAISGGGTCGTKGVMLLANAVHWFNPLVWRMAGQAGRDLELYCDEAVVEGQGQRLPPPLWTGAPAGIVRGRDRGPNYPAGGHGDERKDHEPVFTKKKGTALVAAVVCAALLCGGAVAWGPSSAAGAQDLPPGGGGAAPAGDGERGPQRRREPGALHSARAGGGRGLEGADLRPLRGGGPGLHERPPGHAGRLGTAALL